MATASSSCGPFLTVGRDASLRLGTARVFLNGVNLAWVNWGSDFAPPDDGSAAASYCGIEEAMRWLVANGGNALRLWVFEEPRQSLLWSEDGLVIGLADGVVPSAVAVLELAAAYGVHVVLVLFNGALVRSDEGCSLFSSERVLASLGKNAFFGLSASDSKQEAPFACPALRPTDMAVP